jgi:hypothetical protein
MVTRAHRVEVEVGADGPASAPSSGAAAAAPPANACSTCLLHKKGDPPLLDNNRPIALMNNQLKLWKALIKDACFKSAETHGILSGLHVGLRLLRSIHDALASIIMLMEGA